MMDKVYPLFVYLSPSMRFCVLALILCFHLPAFGQSDSSYNQYRSSNNRYIVEINSGETYVYRSKTYPEFISIYYIDTLQNMLADSSVQEQLQLFYTGNRFSVEKRGLVYYLVKLKATKKPGKIIDLNPVMERSEIEEAINDFQLFSFQFVRIENLSDEFIDYDSYWGEANLTNRMESIPASLPRDEYLAELKHFESVFYDSIRALNVKYTEFVSRFWEDTVSLSEVITFYNEVNSKDSDFSNYRYHRSTIL